MAQHYAVIMAGGVGSRFWPLSRQAYPKQFHDILGTGESLLQATYRRFAVLLPPERIFVVTHQQYTALVREQLPSLPPTNILGEPVARNTAPCVAYAAERIHLLDENAVVAVSPADHYIRHEEKFEQDIALAYKVATQEAAIVTLGIPPTRPDTGYGYIQFKAEKKPQGYYAVKTFTEKPGREMAEAFVASGDFLWNGGLFVFAVPTMLRAFQAHMPETAELFAGVRPQLGTPTEAEAIAQVYAAVKPNSLDYGIMEKERQVYVVKARFGWSDLGTWNALYELRVQKPAKSVVHGDVLDLGSKGSILHNTGQQILVAKGLEDLIVVATPEAILVCPRDQEQSIREVVSALKQHHDGRAT